MYAALATTLREVARAKGYALAVHGSMATDLDLIAAPWTDEAVGAHDLAIAIATAVGCPLSAPTEKPHGRLSWSISLDAPAFWSFDKNRVERHLSNVWIDLSVMPRVDL